MEKIILTNEEPNINADSDELANVIVTRLGLIPRKKGATERMNKVLLELYERSKLAGKEKSPSSSIMTVEEMATFAGITRQTMYDYLKRWLLLDFIIKTSYIDKNDKVIVGYKLNGPTVEIAFEKTRARINNNLDFTQKYILELQKTIKNEKLSKKASYKESSENLSND
jgi:predicted DNA-binding transcriptional regulator AlpA